MSDLTQEELQAKYEEALNQYRSIAKKFGDGSVSLGELQESRRLVRAAQYELLVRAQRELAA